MNAIRLGTGPARLGRCANCDEAGTVREHRVSVAGWPLTITLCEPCGTDFANDCAVTS